MRTSVFGITQALPGPTGERNTLTFAARGAVLCAALQIGVLLNQLAAVLATGNRAIVLAPFGHLLPEGLPQVVRERIELISNVEQCSTLFQLALVEAPIAHSLGPSLAAREGAIVSIIDTTEEGPIALWRLVAERALCVNTSAAGGNATLMTLGL